MSLTSLESSRLIPQRYSNMTKCFKPLIDLAILSAKSSKWTVEIGRMGQHSALSRCVAEWFDALCHTRWKQLWVRPCLRGPVQPAPPHLPVGQKRLGVTTHHQAPLGAGQCHAAPPRVRGSHSFTFQLHVSAFCGIGGAFSDCLVWVIEGVLGGLRGYKGVCRVSFCFRNGSA